MNTLPLDIDFDYIHNSHEYICNISSDTELFSKENNAYPQPLEYLDNHTTHTNQPLVEEKKNVTFYLPIIGSVNRFKLTEIIPNTHKNNTTRETRIATWIKTYGLVKEANCFCGKLINTRTFECAHDHAKHHGGSNHVSNLWATCSQCNTDMGTENLKNWYIARGADRSIFNRTVAQINTAIQLSMFIVDNNQYLIFKASDFVGMPKDVLSNIEFISDQVDMAVPDIHNKLDKVKSTSHILNVGFAVYEGQHSFLREAAPQNSDDMFSFESTPNL